MIEAKVTGIPDLREALRGIVPKLRVRALRNALAAGARVVQRAARGATPVISAGALPVRQGYRKPGTVRQAISVRTSRAARAASSSRGGASPTPANGFTPTWLEGTQMSSSPGSGRRKVPPQGRPKREASSLVTP